MTRRYAGKGRWRHRCEDGRECKTRKGRWAWSRPMKPLKQDEVWTCGACRVNW